MAKVDVTKLDGEAFAAALEALRRGDVVSIDLKGNDGEMIVPHPCVIMSSQEILAAGGIINVVPITSHSGGAKPKPYEVPLKIGDGGLEKASYALPHQVQTADRRRVVQIWGTLSDASVTKIENGLAWALGFPLDD